MGALLQQQLTVTNATPIPHFLHPCLCQRVCIFHPLFLIALSKHFLHTGAREKGERCLRYEYLGIVAPTNGVGNASSHDEG